MDPNEALAEAVKKIRENDLTPQDLEQKTKALETRTRELSNRRSALQARLPNIARIAAEMGVPVSKKAGQPYRRDSMKKLIDDV